MEGKGRKKIGIALEPKPRLGEASKLFFQAKIRGQTGFFFRTIHYFTINILSQKLIINSGLSCLLLAVNQYLEAFVYKNMSSIFVPDFIL